MSGVGKSLNILEPKIQESSKYSLEFSLLL